jgi:hypothetical protein
MTGAHFASCAYLYYLHKSFDSIEEDLRYSGLHRMALGRNMKRLASSIHKTVTIPERTL